MVDTVKVEVCAAVPAMVTEAGCRAQVAGLVAPEGPVTAHVRPTAPVRPATGVTVIVAVFPVVAPAFTVTAPLGTREKS